MRKQMEITSQTRQNLIDAFWEIYCEKRIEKISVKEITIKAGYNRGTFYEYFSDVYDVLEQIENALIPSIDTLPRFVLEKQEIGMPIDMFLELYGKHERYYMVLLGDNGDPSFQSKLKIAIKPLLKQTVESNGAVHEIEMDYVLEFILSGMLGIMSFWFKQEKSLSPESLIKLIHDLMENGVVKKLS